MPFRADPQIRVPATLLAVRDLSGFLQKRCADAGIDDSIALELDLALVEAANNIVQHGLGPDEGEIGLSVDFAGTQVTMTLSDNGPPAPEGLFATPAQAPDHFAESGRGMMIMSQCVDSIEYRREGDVNVLVLKKRLLPR
ncbi:ATP-binding protein [Croceicoccus bisphenolivorans]|uniref:ATP-binding protein n=1 Tax=Croceicoccus bisphenolivorans TaxID=1783232 RepID=UPI0008319088|nr:ATP-binding protein [Croceicoccus bisphenolivorans]